MKKRILVCKGGRMPDTALSHGVLPPDTEVCTHCNGYGSSLKDPLGVDTCTRCGGSGLITNS